MTVIGVMSGSSIDGLDLACCTFTERDGRWSYLVNTAVTVPYEGPMRRRLLGAMQADALTYARLHRDLGELIGMQCRDMARQHGARLIASHGHTVFHQPAFGLTAQVGCGAHIAALAGVPAVCDLRTKDVALGGQGAPLVPLGERMLFPGHQAFLNLGGISNISLHGGRTVGFDVGPCNQALDLLAAEHGAAYDKDGALARSGSVHEGLLRTLDALDFYALPTPRSLGREWFDARMRPVLLDPAIPLPDRLRTAVEHIARQIARMLGGHAQGPVLASGGGAHNAFLLERLRSLCAAPIELPDPAIIDFKEAIIFAFLGLQRWLGRPNALAEVTGAVRDSVGGAIHLPD